MITKILLDTNILIQREDNEPLSKSLQKFLRLMAKDFFKVYIHPATYDDVKNDTDENRRKITLSKLNSYDELKNPPSFEDDENFKGKITIGRSNDYNDALLLYSLYTKKVDFLITEDLGIHKRSKTFDLEEQVLTIDEALKYLDIQMPFKPETIKKTTADNLDINDPFFDSLKEDYPEFNHWFEKISKEERNCLIYTENGKLGALLVYKLENENIDLVNETLIPKPRIKIATMKVSSTGNKIGELFLYWIINYAISLGYEEVYLTHFIKENDDLVYLIEEYGFKFVGDNVRSEAVYIKNINKDEILEEINMNDDSFSDIAKKYYPYFCDNENVRKFIVPIKPEFHEKLFLKQIVQTRLESFSEEGFGEYPSNLIATNTIKKAYLSHANANLKEGDLVLFYETDKKGIADIGVVESFYRVDNLNDLHQLISKRSVFSLEELEELIKTEVSVMLFIHSKTYDYKISYDELVESGIISGPIQSTQSLSHDKYLIIKDIFKRNTY